MQSQEKLSLEVSRTAGPERFPALNCPTCKKNLKFGSASFVCPSCSYRLRLSDSGILCSPTDPDYFRHRLSRTEIERYISDVDRLGWPRAFYQLQRSTAHHRAELFADMANSGRASWRFLTPITSASSVLILGVSNEVTALELAQSSASVVAVDASRLRLVALAQHARFLRLQNLCLMHGGDLSRLPLLDGCFDLVVISDLQDWLPQLPGEATRQIPISFLKSLRRLLKPSGVLYVAGDNRFTYSGLFGLKEVLGDEDDSGGRSGSGSGNRRRGRKSSTSSHSYRGYQRSLRESGMYPQTVYAPVPDHREPLEMVDLTSSSSKPSVSSVSTQGLSSMLKSKMRTNPHFLRAFGQSFAMISTNSPGKLESQFDRILGLLTAELNLPPVELEEYWMGRTEATAVCRCEQGQLVLRLPYNRNETHLFVRNSRALSRLHELKLPSGLTKLIPQSLFCGEVLGQKVAIELRPAGVRLNEVASQYRPQPIIDSLEGIVQMLAAYRCSGSVTWQVSGRKRFQEVCREAATGFIDPAIRKSFESICQQLDRRLACLSLSSVLAHGDFRVNHVLVENDRVVPTAVLNWGAMTEYGLPGWDLISLESSLIQSRSEYSFGESVVWLWTNGYFGGFRPVWQRYCEQTGCHEDLRNYLLMCFWVRGVWQRFRESMASLDYEWIKRNVISVIERIDRI